jgi:hypothetical protein
MLERGVNYEANFARLEHATFPCIWDPKLFHEEATYINKHYYPSEWIEFLNPHEEGDDFHCPVEPKGSRVNKRCALYSSSRRQRN